MEDLFKELVVVESPEKYYQVCTKKKSGMIHIAMFAKYESAVDFAICNMTDWYICPMTDDRPLYSYDQLREDFMFINDRHISEATDSELIDFILER